MSRLFATEACSQGTLELRYGTARLSACDLDSLGSIQMSTQCHIRKIPN